MAIHYDAEKVVKEVEDARKKDLKQEIKKQYDETK